jgi:hypothetical protein
MEISTKKYYYTDIPNSNNVKKEICIIEVFNGDCFDAANMYIDSVIHNFANNTMPGGPTSQFDHNGLLTWQNPHANTQEDQIVRKYQHNLKLYPNMYPICDDSKKNGEAILYSKCGILKPVLTIAAPIKPNFENKKTYDTLINRMHLILYVSWKYNHILVTGLWGCGAFGANPQKMAELWQYAIDTAKFVPKKIVFAIILDGYSNKWGTNVSEYFRKIK